MPNVIDDTGFSRVRFQELRSEKEVEIKDAFDNQNLKTDPQSGVGQEVSLSTFSEDDLASSFQTLLSAFDPTAAQGAHQDRLSILMNKRRQDATESSVMLTIAADASGGTAPSGFIVSDGVNDFITRSELVVAPSSSAEVEAFCSVVGPIEASAGTINQIKTPEFGIVSATNLADATPGRNRETDTELRARMLASSADESSTVVGIETAISNVDGVTSLSLIENRTDVVDSIGVPPHSVFPVIEGGADSDIARALVAGGVAGGIGYTEPSDIPAANIVSDTYTSPITGAEWLAYWARPSQIQVYVEATINKLSSYPADGDARVKQAIVDYIEATFGPGDDLYASQLYCPIQTVQGAIAVSVTVGTSPSPVDSNVITLPYEVISVDEADITIVTAP